MSEKNSIWKEMDKQLCEDLTQFCKPSIQFKNGQQQIIGFKSNGKKGEGPRSDCMLTDGKTLLAIEVENTQTHPDSNVTKYWLLYENYHKYDLIILYHIYTRLYESYPWPKEQAEFCASQMIKAKVPLEYTVKDFRNNDDYYASYASVKKEIRDRIKQLGWNK